MTAALTALDATFLELEQADASAHMHIGAVLVFDGDPEHPRPSRERVAGRILHRIDGMPRLTQRLSDPNVAGLRRPTWVAHEAFDIMDHVRHAALPAPGDEAELLEWAGDHFSHRLDRRRPLWEVTILEGLAGGRWALVTKLHHCLVDGVGSVEVLRLLADGAGVDGAPAGAAATPGVLRQLAGAAAHPRRTLAEVEAVAEWLVRDELMGAPACSINAPIGEERRLEVVRTDLARVRRIRKGLGGTVNDVVLTAVAGGLRALLQARGEPLPEQGLRAMVPVNVRPEGDGASLGNRIVSLFVPLPVAEADVLDRHQAVVRTTLAHKAGTGAVGAASLLAVTEHLPPVAHNVFARASFGKRLFNVTVTNVPGSREPVHAFGARLTDVVPLVPLAAGHGIGVAIVSYEDRLTLCVNADRDTVPDAEEVRAGIEQTLAELDACSGPVNPRALQ